MNGRLRLLFITVRCQAGIGKRDRDELLEDFEFEFQRFAADDEAKIKLPEAAKPAGVVDHKFEAQHAPEAQQADVDAPFDHAGAGIKTRLAVNALGIKVIERKRIEMPAVSGITERAEISVMRRGDEDRSTSSCDAVEFLHGGDDVGDVFDDVNGADFVKYAFAKGKRAAVNVAEDIGRGTGIFVNANGAGRFYDTAADIKDSMQGAILSG